MLTKSQIRWAMSHDWFVALCGETIIVRDCYVLDGVLYENDLVWTGSFDELRDWAGY